MPDDSLLKEFSQAGLCDFCKRQCDKRVPHHLRRRGMGSGSRMDIRINLAGLCLTIPGVYTGCHDGVHDGKITGSDMLAVVAEREGCFQDEIEAAVNLLLAWDKGKEVNMRSARQWGLGGRAASLATKAYWEWKERTGK